MGFINLKKIHHAVWISQPLPVLRFAAEELSSYFQKTVGVPLSINGNWQTAGFILKLDGGIGDPLDDYYRIEEKDETVYIIGVNGRSVLYGVYRFLEEYLDICFVHPWYEHIPRLTNEERNISPISAKASIRKRGFNINPSGPEFLDAAVKQGYNVCTLKFEEWETDKERYWPEILKRDMWLDVGGHCMDAFIHFKDTFRDHPDWFGLCNGKRMDKQPCLSNPHIIDLFVKNAVDFCRQNPQIHNLTIWPNDNGHGCQCERCRALGFNQTYTHLMGELQKALEHQEIPITVQHSAYNADLDWDMLETIPAKCTVDTLIAPWGRNYSQPLSQDKTPRGQRFKRIIESWAASCKKNGTTLTMYEYYGDYWMHSVLFPALGHVIIEDVAYYKRLGASMLRSLNLRYNGTVASIYALTRRPLPKDASAYEYNSELSVMWFNIHVLGRALWNTNASYTEVTQAYCAGCYGSYAEEAAALLDILEKELTPLGEFSTTLFRRRFADVWFRDVHSLEVLETLQEWSPEIEQMEELDDCIQAAAAVRNRLGPVLKKLGTLSGDLADLQYQNFLKLTDYFRFLIVKLDSIHKQYRAQKQIVLRDYPAALSLLEDALMEEYSIRGHQAKDCENWIEKLKVLLSS